MTHGLAETTLVYGGVHRKYQNVVVYPLIWLRHDADLERGARVDILDGVDGNATRLGDFFQSLFRYRCHGWWYSLNGYAMAMKRKKNEVCSLCYLAECVRITA